LLLGILLLKYYQYAIGYSDGVSYISISHKYVSGDFSNAINGCWSPLFSWLLVPFLVIGLPTHIAVKVLSLIIGLLTLLGIRRLSYAFDMRNSVRVIVLFSMIPIILWCALVAVTPDLLVVCILVYYLSIIFSSDYSEKMSQGILCGVLGGLAYLSKSYAFYFFASHFLLFNFLHYLNSSSLRRNILRNLVCGFVVFFIISSVWIGLISHKYGKLTLSTAVGYNNYLVGPESTPDPIKFPPWTRPTPCRQGLLEPPNETAVSSWEDPSYFVLKSWSPLDSAASFKHQLKLIYTNVDQLINLYILFSPIAPVIIVAYLIFCLNSLNHLRLAKDNRLYPLLTLVLFPVGYLLLHVIHRYVWVNWVLLMLMGGHCVEVLLQGEFFGKYKKIVLVFFALSFAAYPMYSLLKNINIGKDIYDQSKILHEQYNIEGRIASNTSWVNSMYLSYYLNSKYYGVPQDGISEAELETQLKKNNIDYYFVWGSDIELPCFLSNSKEKTDGQMHGLKIYSLKKASVRQPKHR